MDPMRLSGLQEAARLAHLCRLHPLRHPCVPPDRRWPAAAGCCLPLRPTGRNRRENGCTGELHVELHVGWVAAVPKQTMLPKLPVQLIDEPSIAGGGWKRWLTASWLGSTKLSGCVVA